MTNRLKNSLYLWKFSEAMKRWLYIMVLMTAVGLTGCGSNEGEDMVGVANNPTQFFGCTLGDDADDVIETLKDAKT